MKENLKCKNMNRTLSNNKPTIAFEAKYPKGQKLIETRCKNFFFEFENA
jgi:hypothetical protein